MKYCAQCGSEYRDEVVECADCGGRELIGADEMRRRGLPLPHELDTRKLVRAGTAEDPLSAEQLAAALEDAGIPTLSRPRRGGTVDALTTGASQNWWELLVPEEHVTKASALLADERARLEASADEAARAAEEEEAESEREAPAPQRAGGPPTS